MDDLERGDEINVSEYAEFFGKGVRRWLYVSDNSHKERYGWGIPEDSITLDRLFYTSEHNGPKVDFHEPELIEDFTAVRGDAAREESMPIPEKAVDMGVQSDPISPSIPSVTELSEIIHISSMDFKTMVVKGLAEAIKQGKNFIELPPVLIEMHKEELLDLGYEVRFSAIYWDYLD